MAIKASNAITFTEQKQIVKIVKWYLATDKSEGVGRDDPNWSTEIQQADAKNIYLWSFDEIVYSIGWSDFSDPVIIGTYGSVKDIVNYYIVTRDTESPEAPEDSSLNGWTSNFNEIQLSNENKYLWNYEIIIYADNTTKTNGPVVIGIYGDSGQDAIVFKIYSTDGLYFIDSPDLNDVVDTIELKLMAYKGNKDITNEATYKWEWFDNDIHDYSPITQEEAGTTETTFVVESSYEYALSDLKCIMHYEENGVNYDCEDHIMLRRRNDVYSATINFFNNQTNIFQMGQEYVAGYIEVYKNNELQETIIESYVDNYVFVNDGIIKENYTEQVNGENVRLTRNPQIDVSDLNEGDLFPHYFILRNDNGRYEMSLGVFDGENWVQATSKQAKKYETVYIYKINENDSIKSNVFLINKSDINRTKELKIDVYTDISNASAMQTLYLSGEERIMEPSNSPIATVSAVIVDLNDTVVGSDTPTNPCNGQMWFNTDSNILLIYNDGKWSPAYEQKDGKKVYTSQPDQYAQGDLWIVEDSNEMFEPGSILVASKTSTVFNSTDWKDAVANLSKVMSDLKQHIDFDSTDGLKIGNKTNNNWGSYVQITGDKMSFYAPYVDENGNYVESGEVVTLGNNEAKIRNLTVEENATFTCNTTFNKNINIGSNFKMKIESNGSLSLTVGK